LRIAETSGSDLSPRAHSRRRIRVPLHHADATGSVGIVALADYLQEAAGEHAEALGVGAERLAGDGMYWVLTRLFLRLARAPRGGETIEIDTWPSQRPRQLFLRDFRICGEDGGELIAASSYWALIDAARRKSVKGPAWITDLVEFDPGRATAFPDAPPKRIVRVERSEDVRPRWSDIDVNGHVNNANLIGWLLEVFQTEWLATHALAALDVAFRAECRRDDTVRSCSTRIMGETFLHALLRGDGTEIVRAQSWWQRRESLSNSERPQKRE
jgi:medium-chain acyl-[acyl-carrier-protein] hydrolase